MRPMPCITQTACRARPWAAVPRSRGVGPARAAPLAGVAVGAARAAPLRGRGRLAAAVTVRFRLPRAGRGGAMVPMYRRRCAARRRAGGGLGWGRGGGGGHARRGGASTPPQCARPWSPSPSANMGCAVPAAADPQHPRRKFWPANPPDAGGLPAEPGLAQTDLRRGAAVGGGVRGACTACSSEVAPRALAATLKPPARATHGAVRPRPPPRLCGHWNQASRCSPLVWRP